MSTAFSDFGPLTERRRIERQRQQRRRVMLAAGAASVILILIVMGGAAVAYNASIEDDSSSSSSSPSGGGSGSGSNLISASKSVKMMCAQTDYRDACEKSDDPRVKGAVADCREIYHNAKDDLARTLHGIDAGGMAGVTKRGYQLRILLSAVITHMETCIDGFPDGHLKKQMTGTMESGKELTSNALAIIEKASSVLVALQIPGFTHRRLLGNDEEGNKENEPKVQHSGTLLGERDDDVPAADSRRLLSIEEGTPQWVNGPERRLLKGNFQAKLKPNVVVAKDGSGKFKTINDALGAMPKQYTGRYLIYVKQGVYEEYVTITRAMENVTMYGDGAMKTVISGSRNFVDGLTTYKTATFTHGQPAEHRHGAGPRGRAREHGLRLPVLPLHRRDGAQGRVPPAHPELPRPPLARVLAHAHHGVRHPRVHRQGRVPAVEWRLRAQDAVVRRVRQPGARRRHRRPRHMARLQEGDQQGGGRKVHRAELLARRAVAQAHRDTCQVRLLGVSTYSCGDQRMSMKQRKSSMPSLPMHGGKSLIVHCWEHVHPRTDEIRC
ncbi:putative pectinesterase/pectinesterase inhibitor 13 [Zea mays]|uniref:Putative pectinesterase/pectinesterase inhibitor 13 n=1 Tax=Zea mays TaxID=4577 RepID=A0A1D6KNJ8_MAIZE|nr:putative pectinesterase/pectinesterase inhibitor 13 [Zea mays]